MIVFVLFAVSCSCTVAATPSVTSIYPTTGPVSGFTTVTVTGLTEIDNELLFCKFGSHAPSPGTWIALQTVECTSPAESGATTMAVELSNNNQDFTTSGIVFEYQADATVVSLSNDRGPECMLLLFVTTI